MQIKNQHNQSTLS